MDDALRAVKTKVLSSLDMADSPEKLKREKSPACGERHRRDAEGFWKNQRGGAKAGGGQPDS
jgi:hypothetical protein